MLDFCFRYQREPLYIIELQLSVMPSIAIENLTKYHDWISRLNLINPIPWFDLIISILWFDLISSSIWSDLIKSYILIQFNNFALTVINLTYPGKAMKGDTNHITENMIC